MRVESVVCVCVCGVRVCVINKRLVGQKHLACILAETVKLSIALTQINK